MQNNNLTTSIQFKPYSKNQQVNDTSTELTKLITKKPHIVHRMDLDYPSISSASKPVKSLHKPLQGLKQIDALFLSLDERHLQRNVDLSLISMKLKSLSFLQHLKIVIDKVPRISPQGYVCLVKALAHIRLLSHLTLYFTSCKWVNDKTLHLLFQNLKRNKNLQSLSLSFVNSSKITEETFKAFASACKHSLQSLKELQFRVLGLNFKRGKALDFIASALLSLKDLQKLQIGLLGVQGSQEVDFIPLMSSVQHLKSLKSLNFNLSGVPVSVKSLKHLTTSFASRKQLHTLSLSFMLSEKFHAPEMETLAQSFQSLASSLKKLTLELRFCPGMNDKTLEILSDGIKTLKNLSEISLNCSMCSNIGEAGVARLTRVLGSLPNLSSVALDFQGCIRMSKAYYDDLQANQNIKTLDFKSARY